MQFVGKWNALIGMLAVIAGFIGYVLAISVVNPIASDATAACFAAACFAIATAAGIVAVVAHWLNREKDSRTDSYQEHEVMKYLSLAYVAMSLAVFFAVWVGMENSYGEQIFLVAPFLAAVFFADAAATVPRHIYLQESRLWRDGAAIPFVGPFVYGLWLWRHARPRQLA